MIFPYRTSIQPRRTPYANYALIVVNVVIFLLTYYPHINPMTGPEILRPWAQGFQLFPKDPAWWQFVSYAFLHAGTMHIFGNMFFLWLFGNNVNDRMGHLWYLIFYLAGAAFSGMGHAVLNSASGMPTLGASGAVAAVTGAYLVLFPQTLITVLYWLIFIGTVEVPALYFIVFKLIVWDNIIGRGIPHVAYDAHLSGYAFGIAGVLTALFIGLLPRSTFDLASMLKQWNRRRRYREVVSSGCEPFTGQHAAKVINAKEVKKFAPQDAKTEQIRRLKQQIDSYIASRNLHSATRAYQELVEIDSTQFVSRQSLLDIANQLASENNSAEAARAYEKFLEHYSSYEYIEQVQLMLGLLYARYLDKPEPAKRHLEVAAEKLTEPRQLQMCRAELDRLKER